MKIEDGFFELPGGKWILERSFLCVSEMHGFS